MIATFQRPLDRLRRRALQPVQPRHALPAGTSSDADGLSVTDALRKLDAEEAAQRQPSFTAAPVPPTGPFRQVVPAYAPLACADPLHPAVRVFPAEQAKIGDSLDPRRAWEQPSEPEPGTSVVLYCGQGWPSKVVALRKRDGLFEDLHKLVEDGQGRNLAECRTALRHSREQMVRRAVALCESLGCREQAAELLHRVEQYNAAAAQSREARAA